MDPRYYHENFNSTILNCYKDLIEKFHFQVTIDDGKYSGITLSNDKCIILFGYDSGFISSSFVNPTEKAEKLKIVGKDGLPSWYPHYSIFSMWKFFFPNDSVNYSYTGGDIKEQILADKRLILERFTNVLNGDFSWTRAYKDNDNRITKKIEYMTNHWAYDNPVAIKFRNGDSSWETAFDEYKNYLDGLQQ